MSSFLLGLSLILLGGVSVNYLAYINYIFGRVRASRYIHKRLVEAITGSTLRSGHSNQRSASSQSNSPLLP